MSPKKRNLERVLLAIDSWDKPKVSTLLLVPYPINEADRTQLSIRGVKQSMMISPDWFLS